jgi:FixJ family two-component response regulator
MSVHDAPIEDVICLRTFSAICRSLPWGSWVGLKEVRFEGLLVCIVDDDKSMQESLPDLLREFGLVSKTFGGAADFLASGLADQTKCLILDIAMPGMTGIELKDELVRRGYSIPIIFITAEPDAVSRPEVQKDAVACLIKPFSDTALMEALRKALTSKRDD